MLDRASGGSAGTGITVTPDRTHGPQAGQDSDGQEIIAIRSAFPVWNVWRSDQGGWWASRRHPLRPSRWPGGYALTVAADDARALCEQLARQPSDP
jgi:hypothetical protein